MLPAQPSLSPFSFLFPDSSCGCWLLPCWPPFKPSQWCFPILLWKFPNESQNKPFCFRSSHIRHLIMPVEASWSGRSSCLMPQMTLPRVCCLYFLNTAPWGACFYIYIYIFFREKKQNPVSSLSTNCQNVIFLIYKNFFWFSPILTGNSISDFNIAVKFLETSVKYFLYMAVAHSGVSWGQWVHSAPTAADTPWGETLWGCLSPKKKTYLVVIGLIPCLQDPEVSYSV